MKIVFGIVAVSMLMTGCASLAVTDTRLEQNTAFSLGLGASDFTISNRLNDGLRTTYSVTTKTGREYNCYVMGTVGITGRNVSDAVCSERGKQTVNPLTGR